MEGKSGMQTGPRLAPPRLQALSFRSGPPPTFIAMPLSEKDDLPFIVVTPSSPSLETEFHVDYYSPEQEKQGFFSSVTSYSPFGSRRYSSVGYPYHTSTSSSSWFSAKQIKIFFLVLLPVLIFAHLVVSPDVESGFYDLISSARTGHAHATGMHLLHSAEVSADDTLFWSDSPALMDDVSVESGLEGIPVATPVITATVTKYEDGLPTAEASVLPAEPAAAEYGASTEL